MKSLKTALGVSFATLLLTGLAFADQIGVVDVNLVSQKYTKAITVAGQVKTREEELQKLRDTLQGQLKASEKLSPLEKKSLEEKLAGQFGARLKEYRDWTLAQDDAIRTDIETAIQTVSKAQTLDLVLPKQTVIQGGKDITQDVINSLNK